MRTIEVPSPLKTRRIIIRDIFFASFIALCIFGFLLQKSLDRSEPVSIEILENSPQRHVEQTESKKLIYIPSRESEELKIDRRNGWRRYLETLPESQEVKKWIYRITMCESSGYPLAENQEHIIINDVDYGTAKGLLQFLDGTWIRFGCEGNVFNEYDAIECGIKAYKMGRQSEWACN